MNNPNKVKPIHKNAFSAYATAYIDKGISVIPDKYGSKQPAIKDWSSFCYKLPTKADIYKWSNYFTETNLAVCLGEASGIIALDLDTDDKELLDIILPLLPHSPVEKRGSKGFTRFFRYKGESTQMVKFNGECILEVLSSGKKSTIPPSIHPNGASYVWTSDLTLLDVEINELPLVPPFLIANIESKLQLLKPDTIQGKVGQFTSGRNNNLSQLCGKLISDNETVDTCVKKLIEFDTQNHEIPLFSDPAEQRHTEPFTNALAFYSNHLATVNTKHYRKNETYEIPITASAVNVEHAKVVGASGKQKVANVRKSKRVLPPVSGALGSIYSNIMENSFVPQEEFAFSASLVLISTLISRKMVFQGMSPNLYLLNIAPSGAGKDACQQKLKEYLIDIKAEQLLGAGDYVSDASLVDSLQTKPVRLDIMDEAGGILKVVNTGKSEYNGKMADVLAELYTSSNSKYLGRALAEGTKGGCFRPNVNILASTTPAGFREGISLKAIEKGLMGRFLIFQGDSRKAAKRVKNFTHLDGSTLDFLRYLVSITPEKSEQKIGDITQQYINVRATAKANLLLDDIFEEFDEKRRTMRETEASLPIVARLYQQMVKLCLIHSVSRMSLGTLPEVDTEDVEFAYQTIMFYYANIENIIDKYIYKGPQDETVNKILNMIGEEGSITKRSLAQRTREIKKRQRDEIILDLIDTGDIVVESESVNGQVQTVYKSTRGLGI